MKIAIIGAGLLGRFLAISCQRYAKVSLFEQGELANLSTTGRIAAAMVAPTAESVACSEQVVKMGEYSQQLWPELLDMIDGRACYQAQGSLILTHPQDRADTDLFLTQLKSSQQAKVERLSEAQLRGLEPELNGFNQALFLKGEGHIDNTRVYTLLEQALARTGVEVIENCFVKGDEFSQLASRNDWVVDTRGIGAKDGWASMNKSLRGVRGEVVRVHAPEVSISRPVRLMHPRYPLYIVPKPNYEYVIGATEIESENEGPMTLRSAMELLSAAYSIHTGFAEAQIHSINAGLRPTLSDNEPSITIENRIIRANGLYRHGFLITPLMVKVIEQLMTGEAGDKAFDLSDFKELVLS